MNYFPARLPSVLHGDDVAGRDDSAERREVAARKAARAARLPGAADRAEGLRRPAVPGLHPAVSGVGSRGQDDAQRGPETRLAQAEAATPPAGTTPSYLHHTSLPLYTFRLLKSKYSNRDGPDHCSEKRSSHYQ